MATVKRKAGSTKQLRLGQWYCRRSDASYECFQQYCTDDYSGLLRNLYIHTYVNVRYILLLTPRNRYFRLYAAAEKFDNLLHVILTFTVTLHEWSDIAKIWYNKINFLCFIWLRCHLLNTQSISMLSKPNLRLINQPFTFLFQTCAF